MSTLDATDLRILDCLQRDAQMPRKALAAVCHISEATCSRRLVSLEKRGYITGHRVVLNAAKLGFGISLFVLVRMEADTGVARKRFETRLRKSPLVQRMSLISGEYDYILHIVAKDMERYHNFAEAMLTEENDVRKYLSLFEMKHLHENHVLPLDFKDA